MNTMIKDLPETIKKEALREQYKAEGIKDENQILSIAFFWENSDFGQEIWEAVDDADYGPFYEAYYKAPEKWCIKITKENVSLLNQYLHLFKENYIGYNKGWNVTPHELETYYFYNKNEKMYPVHSIFERKKGYTKITTKQFKRYFPLIEDKLYTIQDLTEGRVAIEGKGNIEKLKDVLIAAFPRGEFPLIFASSSKYYLAKTQDEWTEAEETTLPVQSIKKFYKQLSNLSTQQTTQETEQYHKEDENIFKDVLTNIIDILGKPPLAPPSPSTTQEYTNGQKVLVRDRKNQGWIEGTYIGKDPDELSKYNHIVRTTTGYGGWIDIKPA